MYSLYNTDFYSGIYDNHIVLGGFNMVPSHAQFLAVMEHYNYYNLIKKTTGIYDNHIVLGGFNMVPSHAQFLAVMKHYNYYNLIKKITLFLKAMVHT